MKKLVVIAAIAALGACRSMPDEPLRATAALQPSAKGGKAIGEATFEQEGGKVHVTVFAQGLKPGQAHGFRILESGDCGAPPDRGAASLPALQAGKDGHANLDAEVAGVTIAPGPASIVGRGLVIDDSGARIACGVIRAG